MASIIPNAEKVKALGQVNEILSDVRFINEMLTAAGEYRIMAPDRKRPVQVDEGLTDRILDVLLRMKKSRAKEIERLASRYGIELEEDEKLQIRCS